MRFAVFTVVITMVFVACGHVLNTLADIGAICSFVLSTDDRNWKRWEFEPGDFSFSETGKVYRLSMSPRRMCPLKVLVVCEDGDMCRWRSAENVTAGFSSRLKIVHNGHDWRTEFVNRVKSAYYQDFREIWHTLFVVNPAAFDWHYKGEITLEVEVISPPVEKVYLDKVSLKLVLTETSRME